MDFQLFTLIHSLANRSWIVDTAGIALSVYALPLLCLIVLVLGIRNRTLIVQGVISSGIAYILNAIIGYFVGRSRPFVDHAIHPLIVKAASSKSFPSDHAALSFALASILAFFYPKWSIVFFIIAFLISISRVFVGVHYPLDVIAGACIGIASAFIARRVYSI